ncbi:MAG: GNAT family N-acetyltransferase [Planctomycetaceae bacterium]|nr:GNAT family N-acetyltransferase [Planctomycetaceae bacterium]
MLLSNTQREPLPNTAAQSPLTLRTFGPELAVEMLLKWQELERRIGSSQLATSRNWTETWLRHFGDVTPHEFVTAEQDGVTRGVCLLTRSQIHSKWPFRINSLHLGTAGEPPDDGVWVEYNGLLVEEAYRSEFTSALIAHAHDDPTWDQLHLDGFSRDEAQLLLDQLPGVEIETKLSRYFDLQTVRESGSEILPMLGRSSRSNIRRRLREYGEVTIEWVDNLSQAESVFSELVTLHQARWQADGKPGLFSSQRFHDFQLELMTRCLDEGRVVLFRVRQGEQTVGCLFLLVDNNRLLDYLSGFASFDQFASPGLIVHYLCMTEALRRGYNAYDFLAGEHQHKRNLSNATADLLWATWRRPRLKFRLMDAARTIKRKLVDSPSRVDD